MANILKMHEQNTITELAAKGWSRRRIARELNIDRKTVRRYLKAASKSPPISTPGSAESTGSKSPISTPGELTGPESVTDALTLQAGRPGSCEPHRELIQKKLETGLSAQRIYQDLVSEAGFSHSYQSVKRFVRQLRQRQPERVWRIEVQPGEEVQIDFGAGAAILDPDRRRRRPWVLRTILSFSRKAYSEAVFHQTTENLIRCLENAFRSFGGVPLTVNLDNLRAAVHKADWSDPELNPKLLSFCRHYGCSLVPCRPRGCFHCYCPAMPGVRFANHGHTQKEWGTYLYPKEGIVDALRDQLRSFTPDKTRRTEWGDGWILMSFLTDCYTPSEAKFKLTRQCLRMMLEAGHKVRLQTRSVLVERDFDLLKAHRDRVILGTSLSHLDDKLARCLEPRAAAPTRRLRMLERAAALDIPVYVALAPYLPFHDDAVFEEVVQAIKPLKPRQVFCEVLNPKGDNIAMMREALSPGFPQYADRLASYTGEYWARFTWRILAHGLKHTAQFIPWPDTRRSWRPHLEPECADFLETFLPPRTPASAMAG